MPIQPIPLTELRKAQFERFRERIYPDVVFVNKHTDLVRGHRKKIVEKGDERFTDVFMDIYEPTVSDPTYAGEVSKIETIEMWNAFYERYLQYYDFSDIDPTKEQQKFDQWLHDWIMSLNNSTVRPNLFRFHYDRQRGHMTRIQIIEKKTDEPTNMEFHIVLKWRVL